MVSIFADVIMTDSTDISLDNGQSVNTAFDLTLPSVNVDSILGGFTYIETAILTLQFTPAIDIQANHPNLDGTAKIGVKPLFEFENTLDLFSEIDFIDVFSQTIPGDGTGTIGGNENEAVVPIDAYADIPADVAFTTGGSSDGVAPTIDGDQTVTADYSMRFIGRQP